MSTLTFLEVSNLISDSLGFPADQVPAILRRVRLFDAKGLLDTTREETGRREGKLNREGAATALIFSELLDMGLDVATLRELAPKMNLRNLNCGQTEFGVVLDALDTGAPVALKIELRHGKGADDRRAYHFEGHRPQSAKVEAALALKDAAGGVTVATVLNVDLPALLSRFLAAFDSATNGKS